MQITTQRARRPSPLAIPTRRERESFEQNKSIKLKNFALLPDVTSMSREELSPELSMDSEKVESKGIYLPDFQETQIWEKANKTVGLDVVLRLSNNICS